MSDFLLDLGQNPRARRLIKSLGLPIPVPQKLARADGPWQARPLADVPVVFGSAHGGSLAAVVAKTLVQAGADPYLTNGDGPAFRDAGEAYGRPAHQIDVGALDDGLRPHALVFDATAITDTKGLRALYDFFNPLIPRLATCGRVVLLGRPAASATTAQAAAAQAALDGFVRSLSKEIGKKGATAQVIYVAEGAEAHIEGPLRFVLSRRSAFVSGQPITVTRGAAIAPEWVRPLDGKVALVTGAARGIGAATARLLAAEGARVVCLDRPADDEPTSRVAQEIGGWPLLVDVTDENAPDIISDELRERFGGVDIVVHNAGITRDKTLARMKAEHWDQAIGVNLTAVAAITAALADNKVLRDGGRIVCLSSVAGIAGNMGQTNYAASKAGVIGLVKQLASALAGRGITVNAIAPGFIETRLTAAIPVMIREVGRRLSSVGQGGQPQDVAEVITFLATPGASGINGQVIRVCGGAFIGA